MPLTSRDRDMTCPSGTRRPRPAIDTGRHVTGSWRGRRRRRCRNRNMGRALVVTVARCVRAIGIHLAELGRARILQRRGSRRRWRGRWRRGWLRDRAAASLAEALVALILRNPISAAILACCGRCSARWRRRTKGAVRLLRPALVPTCRLLHARVHHDTAFVQSVARRTPGAPLPRLAAQGNTGLATVAHWFWHSVLPPTWSQSLLGQ